MRRIVACPVCRRQYNVTKQRTGTKFRCSCGNALTVKLPRGHDAAVVRCSSCGAPRQEEAEACDHCDSDFTLHERDLNTVCPACLARVSDRARYCHFCATPLLAEAIATEKSDVSCPACKTRNKLISRRLGDHPLAVLECQKCAGLWIEILTLDQLFELESRRKEKPVVFADSGIRQADTGYRRCAVCRDFMSRRNFARGKSGVIVDVCGEHGVWFDADELSRLVAWVRAGGLEEARQDLARLKNSPDRVRRRIALEADKQNVPRGAMPAGETSQWATALTDIAMHVLRFGVR